MEGYHLEKLDLFEIKGLKRMELCRIHSVLLFLYNKLYHDTRIAFKYSELEYMMNYNLAKDTLVKMQQLGLISILQSPNKKRPVVVELKSNAILQDILNKDRIIEFEEFDDKEKMTAADFKKAIGCSHLYLHFETSQIDSWLQNINRGSWNRYKFLALAKIVTYFKSEISIKTGTLNKRNSVKNKKDIRTNVLELFERIPKDRQEVLKKQLVNTVDYHQIKTDQTIPNMVAGYLNKLGYQEIN